MTPPVDAIRCDSQEECEALVAIYSREAAALRGDVAKLSDDLRAAAAERVQQFDDAQNNILPLEAEADASLKTTLRLGDEKGAFLRVAWQFVRGGAARVGPVSGRGASATLAPGDAGWAVRRAPKQKPGRDRDTADVFEAWCWVARPGAAAPEKLTWRTTCMPRSDADAVREAAAEAAAAARGKTKEFTDAQHGYRRDRDAGERSWFDTLLAYRDLIRHHEQMSIADDYRSAWADLLTSVDGAALVLGDETFVLGRNGEFLLGDAAPPPNPFAVLAAAVLPFDPYEGRRGRVAAW